MNNHPIVVGMGEALWDVLPEGKNWAALPPTLLITYHNLALKAV